MGLTGLGWALLQVLDIMADLPSAWGRNLTICQGHEISVASTLARRKDRSQPTKEKKFWAHGGRGGMQTQIGRSPCDSPLIVPPQFRGTEGVQGWELDRMPPAYHLQAQSLLMETGIDTSPTRVRDTVRRVVHLFQRNRVASSPTAVGDVLYRR